MCNWLIQKYIINNLGVVVKRYDKGLSLGEHDFWDFFTRRTGIHSTLSKIGAGPRGSWLDLQYQWRHIKRPECLYYQPGRNSKGRKNGISVYPIGLARRNQAALSKGMQWVPVHIDSWYEGMTLQALLGIELPAIELSFYNTRYIRLNTKVPCFQSSSIFPGISWEADSIDSHVKIAWKSVGKLRKDRALSNNSQVVS